MRSSEGLRGFFHSARKFMGSSCHTFTFFGFSLGECFRVYQIGFFRAKERKQMTTIITLIIIIIITTILSIIILIIIVVIIMITFIIMVTDIIIYRYQSSPIIIHHPSSPIIIDHPSATSKRVVVLGPVDKYASHVTRLDDDARTQFGVTSSVCGTMSNVQCCYNGERRGR